MIFTFKKWSRFCQRLAQAERLSIPAAAVADATTPYIVLKHDVETDVKKAYQMAKIEAAYGHRGSYYVQAYLMHSAENVALLSEMAAMGHEISYHYDVLDSSKGDMDKAMAEYRHNAALFEQRGFALITVCQHGNPVVERVGYTSNRDFFRNPAVQATFPQTADIMVNFKEMTHTDYRYYSDAGRQFHFIFDPLTNDLVNSDDKNVAYADLDALLTALSAEENHIISTHPHRWCASAAVCVLKNGVFKAIRFVARLLMRIPLCKKIIGRYYYLAKKL